MSNMYSNANDCRELSIMLYRNLSDKIDFYGSTFINTPSGKYLSSYRKNQGEYLFQGNYIPFYYKYSNGEFLRFSVGSTIYSYTSSLGEKLAALSDFYEVLYKKFGQPTLFYTTENDNEELLSFQWAFKNKEEEIEKFKTNTEFDDANVETFILIDEKQEPNENGLPNELSYLVEQDKENYFKHKSGDILTIGYPKMLSKIKNSNN